MKYNTILQPMSPETVKEQHALRNAQIVAIRARRTAFKPPNAQRGSKRIADCSRLTADSRPPAAAVPPPPPIPARQTKKSRSFRPGFFEDYRREPLIVCRNLQIVETDQTVSAVGRQTDYNCAVGCRCRKIDGYRLKLFCSAG